METRSAASMSEFIVNRLGRRVGKRTERSNIQITREIFERMSLTKYIASIPVVHVAGTKGKGTTSALTAELLRKCHNFKSVALFQSPHLIDIRERVLINNQFIEEKQFMALYDQFEQEYYEKCESIFQQQQPTQQQEQQQQQQEQQASISPSEKQQQQEAAVAALGDRTHFFRTMFAFAVFVMQRLSVDAAVIEVGIGGRLDPTNIIPPPSCCVVTSLGLDHTDILGDTIEEIAAEKAGIFKKGAGACISAPQTDYPQTRAILEALAKERAEQDVLYPSPKDFASRDASAVTDDVFEQVAAKKGAHLKENAALALAASRVVGKLFADSSATRGTATAAWWSTNSITEAEKQVLLNFKLDGRSQTIEWTANSPTETQTGAEATNTTREETKKQMTFLIDGAHTVESIRRALKWAFDTTGSHKISIVFGTSRTPGPQLDEMLSTKNAADGEGYLGRIKRFVFINIPELASGKDSAAKCVEYYEQHQKQDLAQKADRHLPPFVSVPCVEAAVELLTNRADQCENGVDRVDDKEIILVVGSMYSAGGALRFLREKGTCVEF